jgi:GDP-mannose 4,6-dehydratase
MREAERALVTGASGFVGSHLIEYLIANTDWRIDAMIRWRSPLDNMANFLHNERVRFLYADLRDSIAIERAVALSKPDYAFHLAAQSFPRTSFDSPLDTLETNVQGTVRLLESLRAHAPNALIHVCSSSEVYGKTPAHLLPIKEDCPFHPASPYAISKVGTDLIARHYAEAYGMRIMVTRMFTHTGPRRGDVFAESSFAKQIAMIEAGMMENPVMVGNLASTRTIADVRDAVRAYYMLLTVNPQLGEVYNIGGAHTCTVEQILQHLVSLSSGKNFLRMRQDPARLRPIDAENQVPDCSKFMLHTGWKPEIVFEQTMQDLLDYWRARVKVSPVMQR